MFFTHCRERKIMEENKLCKACQQTYLETDLHIQKYPINKIRKDWCVVCIKDSLEKAYRWIKTLPAAYSQLEDSVYIDDATELIALYIREHSPSKQKLEDFYVTLDKVEDAYKQVMAGALKYKK